MHYDQRNIWELRSSRVGLETSDNYQQSEIDRKQTASTCTQGCSFCTRSVVFGLCIGMLLAGIGFAVFLTLYFLKEESKVTCTTTAITVSSITTMATTVSSATTTTMPTTTASVTVTTTSSTATTTSALNVNLIVNGDIETGSCAMNGNVMSPTGWDFSGPISQISYNNPVVTDQQYSYPGPSNRGQCYVMGKASLTTSMWQTIDLINKINFILIDNQTIRYNLSGWLGGLQNQDDNAVVTLSFIDSNNQLVNSTIIGPILAIDRGNQSSLIFQQTNGFVPTGTRSMVVCVTLTRTYGGTNSGAVDNMALVLY